VRAAPPTPAHPQERFDAPLAELTTLRLGGRARRLVEARADDQIVETVAAADAAGEPVPVVAGGSNVVIADAGFGGTWSRSSPAECPRT
jgi:UDP-N-acetylmuramate dehydrogenase